VLKSRDERKRSNWRVQQQRRSRAEAEQLVEAFESSGLRRREFCQQHDVAVGAGFLAEEATEETGDGRRPSAERAQSESQGIGGDRRQACGGGISWNGAKRQVGSGAAVRAASRSL
jgi:hypothetical protein